MEYFANDARVLHNMAKHYRTGEKLPLEVIQNIIASKTLFAASDLQLQVC